jgi:hypothetical protein
MTIPTTCTNCGFGQEHICERSVCPCGCHEDVVITKAADAPHVLAAVEKTMMVLDAQEDVREYAIAD